MVNINKYKWPLITVVIIVAVLMLMIAIGFTIGILSENPDGLERVLIDNNSESWLENLPSPWIPFLSWIQSEYLAGIIGIVVSVGLILFVFYIIKYKKKETVSSQKQI
ncbi:MAG: hypothetical protein ACFFC1_07180 [Promethearchaeota archaeon]